jgi:hypothetical protein
MTKKERLNEVSSMYQAEEKCIQFVVRITRRKETTSKTKTYMRV